VLVTVEILNAGGLPDRFISPGQDMFIRFRENLSCSSVIFAERILYVIETGENSTYEDILPKF
jgi:hypothetical protein